MKKNSLQNLLMIKLILAYYEINCCVQINKKTNED